MFFLRDRLALAGLGGFVFEKAFLYFLMDTRHRFIERYPWILRCWTLPNWNRRLGLFISGAVLLPAQSWFRAHDVCLLAVEIALLIES